MLTDRCRQLECQCQLQPLYTLVSYRCGGSQRVRRANNAAGRIALEKTRWEDGSRQVALLPSMINNEPLAGRNQADACTMHPGWTSLMALESLSKPGRKLSVRFVIINGWSPTKLSPSITFLF